LGQLISYLNPVDPTPNLDPRFRALKEQERRRSASRVIDRQDIQQWLPFGPAASS
jgi:hypothetical protein